MSYWLDHAPAQIVRTTPQLPSQTQVVVIGGGITGVSAAYWLRKYGVEAVLLERRGLSGGATGRNGGHLVSGPADNFSEAVKRYGAQSTRAIYQFTLDTIAAIQAFVAEHSIDCHLMMGGTATLALGADELPQLEETANDLAKYGLPGTWWDAATCAEQTHSDSFIGGLFNPQAGQLWPAKLVIGIAQAAERLGANLQTETEVQEVVRREQRGAGFSVKTSRGEVRADAIVYATNAWTRNLLPQLNEIIVPVRGQAIITAPALRQWNFGLVTNHGYEYCTQRPDGRIVLGGMRWRSPTLEVNCDDDGSLNPEVSAGLRGFLPRYFPALREVQVEQEWAGIMAFTPDYNPLVGRLPERPNEYIAAGYSGHGMPITFGAGKAIAETIAGKESGLVEAFLPGRFL